MESNKLKYVDMLISEIKKMPVIWHNNSKQDRRKKTITAWKLIASKFDKKPEEVKKKWRGLKDTFHLEERKLKLPLVDEGKPLISYYNGQWAHFEKLIFLYGTRSRGKECITLPSENLNEDDSQTCNEDNIKVECDLFEQTDDFETIRLRKLLEQILKNEPDDVAIEETQKVKTEADTTQTVTTESDPKNNFINISVVKRNTDGMHNEKDNIPMLTIEPLPMLPSIPIHVTNSRDEDVLFVRSLVPSFKKLNPIRKLIVKNEMQNLVIKEMLCNRCRTAGPQPNCRCNLS